MSVTKRLLRHFGESFPWDGAGYVHPEHLYYTPSNCWMSEDPEAERPAFPVISYPCIRYKPMQSDPICINRSESFPVDISR